jgi:hypothetical protein
MEILAGLMKLSSPELLPAPWYNRPALGLISGTPVEVSLVESVSASRATSPNQADVPPDIIVTPLKVSKLPSSVSITMDFAESRGVINRVLSIIESNFNIALMETVTIDQRTKHRVCLVLEPPENASDSEESLIKVNKFIDELRIAPGYIKHFVSDLSNDDIRFRRRQFSVVEDESVDFANIRKAIDDKYAHLANIYDFDKVVVSSNSDARFIRYIFPKKGSFEVSVPHADRPTAMQKLAGVISELEYNILPSRVSKSASPIKRQRQESVTVAICEPNEISRDEDEKSIRGKIEDRLLIEEFDDFVFSVNPISFGKFAKTTQSRRVKPGNSRLVEIPDYYMPHILKYRDERRKKIFVSRPTFTGNDRAANLAIEAIYAAIAEKNFAVFDGYEQPTPKEKNDAFEIHARIWSADAAVFLGMGAGGGGEWLSRDQEIEWGVASVITRKIILCGKRDSFSKRRLMMPESIGVTFEDLSDTQNLEEFKFELSRRLEQIFAFGAG